MRYPQSLRANPPPSHSRAKRTGSFTDHFESDCEESDSFTLRDLTDLMASSPAYYQRIDGEERRWVSGEFVGQGRPSAGSRKEKTPVEGPHAVQNWLDLYDRANYLRDTLDLRQPHLRHQAQRAMASLFLYEHQLTARARRQARLALWDREHPTTAPPLHPTLLLAWSRCRCARCQPALHQRPLSRPRGLSRQHALASA
jgi:hypothetical protein